MLNSITGLVLTTVAASAGAQQAGPPQGTIQQAFDSATALEAKGDHAGAVGAWESLEKRVATNRRTTAIVRVRKSASLFKLGRADDAVAAARAGLAVLSPTDPTLVEDRYQANMTLGSISEDALDYSSAADAYRTAAAIAPEPAARLRALRGQIATETFVDPDAALSDLAVAKALLPTARVDAASEALFLRLESELMLNRKQYAAASSAAQAAIKKLGGLTNRIDLNDVAARSDAALASMLLDRTDLARKYMALTGAGRIENRTFDPASNMDVPSCGGEDDLRPEDAAVIEFSIGEDGTVSSATPIWSAGGGRAALEFARAARGWSFDPVKVQTLPAFFRYRARVEMRCSMAFERPSIGRYFDVELQSWLTSRGVPTPVGKPVSDAADLPRQRAALAAAPADTIATLPALMQLMDNALVPREEKNALARRALAIADTQHAPPPARLAIERYVWVTGSTRSWRDGDYLARLMAAMQAPQYLADPQTRAGLRLLAADSLGKRPDRALPLLQQVANDDALPAKHPLRVGALIRIASIEEARGHADVARAAFERSGLSANQCAIADAAPKKLKDSTQSSAFPTEALEWGFEGWTRIEYDVAANGKVVNQRPILSYPPFIFSKAGVKIASNYTFTKSYRPDGGLGCGASSTTTRFLIAN